MKKFWLLFVAAIGVYAIIYLIIPRPVLADGAMFQGLSTYSSGSYTACQLSPNDPNYCNPSAYANQTCDNGPSNTDSGGCPTSGAPACGSGSPWTQYETKCIDAGYYLGNDKCNWGLVQVSAVCSTADKYQPNSTYPGGDSSILDAGSCTCSVGGPYKVCCALD
ncbi:MAG: hypothetical protein M1153_01500, partial [Patescibacteria group bacterium]|nr:hypothetical protein [Patescibacteria group bacterium]